MESDLSRLRAANQRLQEQLEELRAELRALRGFNAPPEEPVRSIRQYGNSRKFLQTDTDACARRTFAFEEARKAASKTYREVYARARKDLAVPAYLHCKRRPTVP